MRKKQNMPPVFILSLFDTGLLTARILKKHKIKVFGFDYSKKQPGFRSNASHAQVCPSPFPEPENLTRFLISKIDDQAIKPVLIPASDEFVRFVNHQRDELGRYFNFLLPEKETIHQFLNKANQLQTASDSGLDVPEWFDQNKVPQIKPEFFPVIIKPVDSKWKKHFNNKGFVVENMDAYNSCIAKINQADVAYFVQKIIDPQKLNNFEINILYLGPEKYYIQTIQKIRQFPDNYGSATCTETCSMPFLEAITLEFVKKNNLYGFSNTEFKFDAENEKYYFIETNLRVWLQIDLTEAQNQNFALLYYQYFYPDFCQQTTTCSNKTKVKWVDLFSDFLSYRQQNKSIWSFFPWLKSIRKASSYGIVSLSDPLPFLYDIQFGLKLFKYLIK